MDTWGDSDGRVAALDEALERDDYHALWQLKTEFAAMSADASLGGDVRGASYWAGLHAQARHRLGVLLTRRKARLAAEAEASGRVALFEFGGA